MHDVSTRAVYDPVKALGMRGVSRSNSEVSRLYEELDARVTAFLGCPIEDN